MVVAIRLDAGVAAKHFSLLTAVDSRRDPGLAPATRAR
jgi:hypothetical protein